MKRVWNAEENDWEYIEDGELEDSPAVAPVGQPETLEDVKARVSRIVEKGEAMTQAERTRRYRAAHPEKYRQYQLNYMTRYRATRKAE